MTRYLDIVVVKSINCGFCKFLNFVTYVMQLVLDFQETDDYLYKSTCYEQME